MIRDRWWVLWTDPPPTHTALWRRWLLRSPRHVVVMRRLGPDAWLLMEWTSPRIHVHCVSARIARTIASRAIAICVASPRHGGTSRPCAVAFASCVLLAAELLGIRIGPLCSPRRFFAILASDPRTRVLRDGGMTWAQAGPVPTTNSRRSAAGSGRNAVACGDWTRSIRSWARLPAQAVWARSSTRRRGRYSVAGDHGNA